MKMSRNNFLLLLLGLAICPCSGGQKQRETPMHKAQLTQKGYIQFLRWQLPVPRITEFTFCLWIQSDDLTHPHSIFSYSKNERERLVRAWISPRGRSVHLEIGGKQVIASTTEIDENRWYHLCLSWENQVGLYGLWINGQLWARGQSEETAGHAIPSGGDIVLGQEYTDFDKGLEEGVEGSVLGFNLLLASAFDPLARDYQHREASSSSSYANAPLFARIPVKLPQPGFDYAARTLPVSNQPRARRYADSFQLPLTNRTAGYKDKVIGSNKEPLGLQLVKLSYVRCEIGRGSPFIGGHLMLISWSRTPVRVFGGAILKNVKSECGNF
ncbi:adhesion G protein-coupled receptor D2 [Osmia lignaria lignaria]|uniref:adhesion G protein-coupled receptor D2 n=1 Tax=Osmia lignaria lignaria TaxID=1437193 RepID=UPI00402B1A36